MKAVIMAGGEGTRLRPVLPGLPKPMALLAGRPVMERIICLLRRCGITDLSVTLRYMPESIMDYFGDGRELGVDIKYHIESEPLGTAGGVRACIDRDFDRDILVISGDAACDFDLRALMECHRRHKSAVTMALYSSAEPLEYGLVLTDPRGRVRSFIEKPTWERVVTNYVNTGIYIVSPRALSMIPENTKYDFARDLFPGMMDQGEEIRGLSMDGYWCDIGTPRAYYQCNLDALDGKLTIFEDCATMSQRLAGEKALSGRTPRVKIHALRSTVPCADRAALMRLLSESLMEAGADFTDGLRLKTPGGGIHIAPDPQGSAVVIQADKAELCDEYTRLASTLNEESF